jgi:SPP1 family predicted phage head-tail adaptor
MGRTLILGIDDRPHKVTLANPGPPIPDGEGGYTEEHTPLTPPDWRCSIRPATVADAERVVAGAIQTTATHLVRGAFRPDIIEATRITYRDRQYEVQSVQNDEERDIALTLVCMEIKDGVTQQTDHRRPDGAASGVAQAAAGARVRGR